MNSNRQNPNLPWAGWKNDKPRSRTERKAMKKACGKKCFLGTKESFPICTKGTCNINDKGVWAAYIRSREFGSKNKKKKSSKNSRSKHSRSKHSRKYYKKIANKSRKILTKKGYNVGKTLKLRRRLSGGNSNTNNNNVVEEGADINNFFGNIGINKPSQPDETLFGN